MFAPPRRVWLASMFHSAKVGTGIARSKHKIRPVLNCARFPGGGNDALASGDFSDTVARQRMNVPSPFWQLLFAPDASSGLPVAVTMQLLSKRGQPLLLLPRPPRLARIGLELYPAQTPRSRLVRSLAAWVLQARLPVVVKPVEVNLSPEDPFVRWLASRAQVALGGIPQFAVLAGNPNSPGQRFILLLFDPTGRPVAVVKVGVTEAARKLIEQERQFLERTPTGTPAIPPLLGTFANAGLQAIAFDFLPGRSPRPADEHLLPKVLRNWLRPQQSIVLADTRFWHELSATSANHPIFKSLTVALRNQSSSSAIVHGDFAPWNVRVAPFGDWMALDWERGDLNGPPAWDWFHYVIQKGILVQRQPATSLAMAIEGLLASKEFKKYAQAAGIIGHERTLVLFYLVYQAEVIRPAEGLAKTSELLKQLSARWP